MKTKKTSDADEILLYKEKGGQTAVEVRFQGETAWLALNQIADLFQRDKSVISRHLRNIVETGELMKSRVVAKNATTAADGKNQVEYYNLDAIISVGYRVNSKRGTACVDPLMCGRRGLRRCVDA